MSTTFSLTNITLRALSAATNLYLEPLLLFRPVRHPLRSAAQPKIKRHQIDTLVGGDTLFVGDVTCEEKGLRIDGHWVGNIVCTNGTVVISDTAKIEGDVFSSFVVVRGGVKGNIVSSGAVEIHAGARIEGNVTAQVVEMHSGASVSGKIEASETPGSEAFIQLRGTVRGISDEAPKVRLVK